MEKRGRAVARSQREHHVTVGLLHVKVGYVNLCQSHHAVGELCLGRLKLLFLLIWGFLWCIHSSEGKGTMFDQGLIRPVETSYSCCWVASLSIQHRCLIVFWFLGFFFHAQPNRCLKKLAILFLHIYSKFLLAGSDLSKNRIYVWVLTKEHF